MVLPGRGESGGGTTQKGRPPRCGRCSHQTAEKCTGLARLGEQQQPTRYGQAGAGGLRGTSSGRGRSLRGGWATCGGDRERARLPWVSRATVACVGHAGAGGPRRARVSEQRELREGSVSRGRGYIHGRGWTVLGIHGRDRLYGMTTNPYRRPPPTRKTTGILFLPQWPSSALC